MTFPFWEKGDRVIFIEKLTEIPYSLLHETTTAEQFSQAQGPQVITRHGHEAAVVLSFEAYQALLRPRENLVDFFASGLLGYLAYTDDLSNENLRRAIIRPPMAGPSVRA